LPAGFVFLFLSVGYAAPAADAEEAVRLLKQADVLRTADYAQFAAILQRLDERSASLAAPQRQYLRYLKGWRSAYDGDYIAAIPMLESFIDESQDPNLQFRAGATLVNVRVLAAQYQAAFAELSRLLKALPSVDDAEARELGLGIAGFLYNQVGQYDLGLSYAEQIMSENNRGRGVCTGGQLRLEALYKSGKLRTADLEFPQGIEACVRANEVIYANVIRTYVARLFLDQGKIDAAVSVLKAHYDEVAAARYPRLTSEYDALLADAYRRKGDATTAHAFALRAIESGVKNQYTEPLTLAYRLLYELERERGDFKSALAYHEKYAAADKGYLDDVSARQVAFEKVQLESTANKLQIEALNKRNQVLQLQRALGEKAVENSRLYIALLLLGLVFIAFWAYKTKLSQLHFMRRSQQDGLTGIANRQHFIEQAEHALQACQREQLEACVILCDLDQFKAINDKYGHAAGDFVLQQAVIACQSHLRPNDIFGRLGGEEFGIVLPGCNAEQARQRSEQLRLAISGISTTPGLESGVSASFGVAGTNASGYELWQLLAHADAALYHAKHAGRNRVAVFDPNSDLRPTVSDATEVPARSFG
jgi:diguanylate cyclase (GGDEF)-like protein